MSPVERAGDGRLQRQIRTRSASAAASFFWTAHALGGEMLAAAEPEDERPGGQLVGLDRTRRRAASSRARYASLTMRTSSPSRTPVEPVGEVDQLVELGGRRRRRTRGRPGASSHLTAAHVTTPIVPCAPVSRRKKSVCAGPLGSACTPPACHWASSDSRAGAGLAGEHASRRCPTPRRSCAAARAGGSCSAGSASAGARAGSRPRTCPPAASSGGVTRMPCSASAACSCG